MRVRRQRGGKAGGEGVRERCPPPAGSAALDRTQGLVQGRGWEDLEWEAQGPSARAGLGG